MYTKLMYIMLVNYVTPCICAFVKKVHLVSLVAIYRLCNWESVPFEKLTCTYDAHDGFQYCDCCFLLSQKEATQTLSSSLTQSMTWLYIMVQCCKKLTGNPSGFPSHSLPAEHFFHTPMCNIWRKCRTTATLPKLQRLFCRKCSGRLPLRIVEGGILGSIVNTVLYSPYV